MLGSFELCVLLGKGSKGVETTDIRERFLTETK